MDAAIKYLLQIYPALKEGGQLGLLENCPMGTNRERTSCNLNFKGRLGSTLHMPLCVEVSHLLCWIYMGARKGIWDLKI